MDIINDIKIFGFWKVIKLLMFHPFKAIKEYFEKKQFEKMIKILENEFEREVEQIKRHAEKERFQRKLKGLIHDLEMIEKYRKIRAKRIDKHREENTNKIVKRSATFF